MNNSTTNPLPKSSNNLEIIFEEKKNIRKQIRALKLELSDAQKEVEANAVFCKIELFQEFKEAKVILIYWSTPDELPTHEIIKKWCVKKQIILPTVVGNDLILKRFSENETMKQGTLGIWEPNSTDNFIGNVDLVIVPGVAFDKGKNRLGRGKGFYDRFFKNRNYVKIGVGFDFQLITSVPSSKMDIKMDKIVVPSQTLA